ncbi:MAG: ATP-dependent helicase HrpB [Geothrix sp.]|uniref:ATP-dependent helicase HrpB n=1 Tax=Geothrix sp. TaxID=1962974 RepID=UPI00181D4343|nr:ATP-dependent helicase HrpB [Geothrix sp.]NWJ40354.1 ATP-dependent helicase HrpB [Geothrix sp.]WIL21641.1 MAG: ATP-dependent helicase HrpB [Geothrix sp.]
MRLSLPIDPLLPRLVESLRRRPNLVLQADPGAGKTTRVPPALLESGLLGEGECWILEPRRLAARLAATRVADELGELLGQRAGYAVRFEQKVSKATRLRFVTEGLLLRRLHGDPGLRGISAVVLDEFHERHLHTDLAITLLRRLQQETRPDLKLLVMSATLDAGPVAAYLDAPVMKSEGRVFPVDTAFLPRPDDRPVEQQVAEALDRLYGEGLRAHTLVFLPGAAEIRACLKGCEAVAGRRGLSLRPLHGELSPEAQAHALEVTDTPKIILSTNVAESSVTLDGIGAVVDSGLGREASHSPWSGLSGLRTVRISQARCVQRTGRAGRTGPGRCLRLYTEADFGARPAFDIPELQRSDLAEPLLALHGMGIGHPEALDWFEAPPATSIGAAEILLTRLGALEDGALSPVGRRMADLPLHSRLARLAVAGEDLGIPQLALRAAALLETGSLSARQGLDRAPVKTGHGADSDLLLRLDQFEEAEAAGFGAGACRAAGLDVAAVQRARRAVQSLTRLLPSPVEPADAESRLLKALLLAYPDRVGQLSANGTCAFAGGGGAKLDPASRVRRPGLILALEAEAVKQGTGGQTLIRQASRCEADWLLEAFPERLEDIDDVVFHASAGRVERRTEIRYDGLSIDVSRGPADPADPRVADLLAQALADRPLDEVPARMLARLAFLRRHRPELELPEDLRLPLLAGACRGRSTLREVQDVDWSAALRQAFPADTLRLLDAWAPEAIQLPKGRPTKVHYEDDPPWIASRLQDFWGLKKSPAVAGGAVPLVLHLLAPNMRAVQVTTDLAGFWQRVYQELRPGLSRRYPKHHWPE